MAFTFEHDGKTFELPAASSFALLVPGAISMDAIMNPDDDMAQTRLSLSMLLNSGAEPAALKALREMPTGSMMTIVNDWMYHQEEGDADLGESSASSS